MNEIYVNLDTAAHNTVLGATLGFSVDATTAFGNDVSDTNTAGGIKDTVLFFENVNGTIDNDWIWGNALANVIDGRAGNDHIDGGAGNDTIVGGDDSDVIVGGLGAGNKLTGGSGADTFGFATKQQSGLTTTTRDIITDFEGSGVAGGDLIDFDYIVQIQRNPRRPAVICLYR